MDLDRIKQHIAHGEQGSVRDFSLALRGVVERTPDAGDFTPRTRSITAGLGLTGGGTLEEDRTLALSEQSLDSLARANSAVQPDDLDWRDYKTSSMLVTDTGWDPREQPVIGRSTPYTATMSLGGHYDMTGAPIRRYKWGLMTWQTNPNTAPMTNISAVSNGWSVRSIDATTRQFGDDGEAHALEVISGQGASEARVRTTDGSPVLQVINVTRPGSKFCIGNEVEGTGIPEGATIVAVTKDGHTDTHRHAYLASYVSGGSGVGLAVDDILEVVGGEYTRPARFRVQNIVSGVVGFLLEDPGNYIEEPENPVSFTKVGGGSTGDLLADISFITAGHGYPETITISEPATSTRSSSTITCVGPATMNIGILITGSGNGGPDRSGNPDGRAIQIQSYGQAAYRYGLFMGGSAVRDDGTNIHAEFAKSRRFLSVVSSSIQEDVFNVSSSSAKRVLRVFNTTLENPVISVSETTASSGLWFSESNSFTGAAIQLNGQDIDTDDAIGMKIGKEGSRRLGFWGATPVPQPAAIPDASEETIVDTVNALLAALRSAGLIAT